MVCYFWRLHVQSIHSSGPRHGRHCVLTFPHRCFLEKIACSQQQRATTGVLKRSVKGSSNPTYSPPLLMFRISPMAMARSSSAGHYPPARGRYSGPDRRGSPKSRAWSRVPAARVEDSCSDVRYRRRGFGGPGSGGRLDQPEGGAETVRRGAVREAGVRRGEQNRLARWVSLCRQNARPLLYNV